MVKQINQFLLLSYEPVTLLNYRCHGLIKLKIFIVALNIKSVKEIFPFVLLFFLFFFFF